MTTDLDSFISVPLQPTLVASLLKRSPHGISSLIENVMWDFLERTEEDFSAPDKTEGIYWESLFLPNGTEVRTKYKNEYKAGSIVNLEIVWENETYTSFAQLANAMRGNTMNNAWRELQIKRPTDKIWMPAQSLRR